MRRLASGLLFAILQGAAGGVVAGGAVAVSGCAGEGGVSFLRSTPTFFTTAQANYEYGVKELKSRDWQTAAQFFQYVKTRFGFSKWATLAELGLADANLGHERFSEAVDGYKQFIKAHPGHERVQDGYAAFKIGEAYVKQIPSDWILAPPSYEKDQGPVHDAQRELQVFLDEHGDSPYTPEARKLLTEAVRRLAEHELYVARFYLDRDKPIAAIGRLEWLIKTYPGAHQEPETLLLLGKTYLKLEKPTEARTTFEKLARGFPGDYRADKARLYIDFIDRRFGPKKL